MLNVRIYEVGDWKGEETIEEQEHQLERVQDNITYIMEELEERDIEIQIHTQIEEYVFFSCEKDITELLNQLEENVDEVVIEIEEYDN